MTASTEGTVTRILAGLTYNPLSRAYHTESLLFITKPSKARCGAVAAVYRASSSAGYTHIWNGDSPRVLNVIGVSMI